MVRGLLLLCALVSSAQAERWYEGRHGTNRVLHVSLTAGGGALYLAGYGLQARLAPETCRWCTPAGFELDTRDALRWSDTERAATASDVTGYLAAPLVGLGLVALYTPPAWADVIDNVVPMVETLVVTSIVTHALKVAVGRQRPYAYDGMQRGSEDNVAFPSGHTAVAFALGTAAATVAQARGYPVAPYVWGAGLTLGAATAYLRIAADRHFVLDALAGGAIGVAAGLTVPRLMRRDVALVPMRGGVALVGTWN